MSNITELENLPGFYKIIGYSKYGITPEGDVQNIQTMKSLRGSINPDGYRLFRLTDDNGVCLTWGLHRLLCYVFKPLDDYVNLVVNHINGDKTDNRLENLEWVTYTGNIHHAGLCGLTSKCIPVTVRDIDTGEITTYPSAIDCGRKLGFTKDAVLYRLSQVDGKIFPERKQYRKGIYTGEWSILEEVLYIREGMTRAVLVKNIFTDVVICFNSAKDVADNLGVSQSTVSKWLNDKQQPVLPGFIQMKWLDDHTPWRIVGDAYVEYEQYSGKRIVLVQNVLTNQTEMFLSSIECAKAKGLLPTTLSNRLKSNGTIVYNDNCSYRYYS